MPARVCGGFTAASLRSDLEWGLLSRRLLGNPRLMIMVALSLVTAPRWIAEELRTNILPPLRIQELQFSRLFSPFPALRRFPAFFLLSSPGGAALPPPPRPRPDRFPGPRIRHLHSMGAAFLKTTVSSMDSVISYSN